MWSYKGSIFGMEYGILKTKIDQVIIGTQADMYFITLE